MKIRIKRINDKVHMRAQNEEGNEIDIDGSEQIGGENQGFRPMQLLLAGIGSCSTIDVVNILKKQREDLDDIEVEINAEREQNAMPAVFQTIHLNFILKGNLNKTKVEKAISLSMDKYCSVARILEKTAKITYTFEIK